MGRAVRTAGAVRANRAVRAGGVVIRRCDVVRTGIAVRTGGTVRAHRPAAEDAARPPAWCGRDNGDGPVRVPVGARQAAASGVPLAATESACGQAGRGGSARGPTRLGRAGTIARTAPVAAGPSAVSSPRKAGIRPPPRVQT